MITSYGSTSQTTENNEMANGLITNSKSTQENIGTGRERGAPYMAKVRETFSNDPVEGLRDAAFVATSFN